MVEKRKGGAPFGNKNALGGKDRDFKNALLRTVKQYEEKGVPRGEALNRVTERLCRTGLCDCDRGCRDIGQYNARSVNHCRKPHVIYDVGNEFLVWF